jgi:hypothetical protein
MKTSVSAERALVWLAAGWDGRDTDDARLAVDALALAAICRLLVDRTAESYKMAISVEDAIARTVPQPAWASVGLVPGLLAAAAAVERDSNLAEGAAAYLRALFDLVAVDSPSANGMFVRLAMSSGERIPSQELDGLSRLRGGEESVLHFLADVEICSGFGTAQLALAEPVGTLLHGAAVSAFRTYDLPRGMRLLRAATYVSAPSRTVPLSFVKSCQCEDGSFGDYATPIAQLRAQDEPNAELRLKIPVSLQALWTMAEAESPSFRLIRAGFAACRAAL